MTQQVHFTKMQGAGNDYIYVDATLCHIADPSAASIAWSDRHKGIGADGLVLIGSAPSDEADFSMRIFNADGSEAMMCGNASRCIGKYLYEKGLTQKTEIRLLTLSGVKNISLNVEGHITRSVTVDMLQPALHCDSQFTGKGGMETTIEVAGKELKGVFISMGNPHFVSFVGRIEDIDVAALGAMAETNKAFPQRCNIEFAQVRPDGSIRMRVWERGSGITMACGTGACATAVAAALTGRTGRKTTVEMDGGTLEIEWKESDSHVLMTGPAEFVYEGEIELNN